VRRQVCFALTVVAAAVTMQAPAGAVPRPRVSGRIDYQNRTRLSGHKLPNANSDTDVGAMSDTEMLAGVTLALKPSVEQEAELDRLLAEQHDPASSNYHNWLTPDEYAERFGVSDEDIKTLTDWLTSEQLEVTSIAKARNAIQVRGTVARINTAFQTEMHRYTVNGTTHFANATDPAIPSGFTVVVRAIHGLNDFRMHPRKTVRKTTDTVLRTNYTSSSGDHYLSPTDLNSIYNIKALHDAGFRGAGQSIVIPGQSRLDLADIQQFRARFGLPPADPETILVPNTRDPGRVVDDMSESDLDLEWAGAIAPEAKLIFVYSWNVMDAVYYAIDQNLAPVITLSYGLCEPLTSRSEALTMQSWAKQANAQGITWVNASGDSGGADCVTSNSTAGAGLSVDLPAGVPEVTAVGGTQFQEAIGGTYWQASNDPNGGSAISYIPEVAWNDSAPGDPAAGGGGTSRYFAKPAWQVGSGIQEGGRNVPDVAFNSSAEHDGYLVYSAGKLEVYGGTSAASPVFAGILALLNQYLVSTGGLARAGLGNVNPSLYSFASSSPGAFHDVQSGNNVVVVTCSGRRRNCTSGSFGFEAVPGYDLATGLGSVDAWTFVTSWRLGLF
jgi:subtilase family serine protease